MGELVKIYSEITPHYHRNEMVLVDGDRHDFASDHRLLIPFVNTKGKIGFYNNNRELVCEPDFDAIFGDCKSEQDVIIVGQAKTVGYTRANGEVAIYEHLKYGVVERTGKLLLEVKYNRIYTNSECSAFVVCIGRKYGVMDRDGKETIPLGLLERNACLKKALNDKYWGVDEYGHYKLPFYKLTDLEFDLNDDELDEVGNFRIL